MKLINKKNYIKLRLKLVRLFSPWSPPQGFPTSGPRVILALAADYGNLGDVAITKAMIGFFKQTLPGHQVYLLTAGRIYRDLRGASRAAGPDDIVAIVGGGNMGDLYPDLEEARRLTMRAFKKQKIISFPQSIDFSPTATGLSEQKKSSKAYSEAAHLTIFARERVSLVKMQEAFAANPVLLSPDIVFSLQPAMPATRGDRLLVCLRQDKEAEIKTQLRSEILNKLSASFRNVEIIDTTVPGPRLSYADYEVLLDQFLSRVVGAKCVVTDRLHGMIFSAITRTPCVVIENSNHKIRATYDTWLLKYPQIIVLKKPTPEEVLQAVQQVTSQPTVAVQLDEFYFDLKKVLTSKS